MSATISSSVSHFGNDDKKKKIVLGLRPIYSVLITVSAGPLVTAGPIKSSFFFLSLATAWHASVFFFVLFF